MQAESGRIRSIDIARGIAILCIVLGHNGIDSVDRVVFTFHVPIFFLIAGYFFPENKRLAELVRGKVRQLLVPYFVTCLAVILLGTVDGLRKGEAMDRLGQWVLAAVYGSGAAYSRPISLIAIGPIWFLWAMLWACLFMKLAMGMKPWLRVTFILALFWAGCATKAWFWFPLSIQSGACATLYVYLGYQFRKTEKLLRQLPGELTMLGLLAAAIIWIAFIRDYQHFWMVNNDYGRGVVDVIGSLCACAVVFFVSSLLDKWGKRLADPLAYVGKYSLFFLCVHTVELDAFPWRDFAWKFFRFGPLADRQYLVIIVLKFISVLLVGWCFTLIPFVRRIFGYRK